MDITLVGAARVPVQLSHKHFVKTITTLSCLRPPCRMEDPAAISSSGRQDLPACVKSLVDMDNRKQFLNPSPDCLQDAPIGIPVRRCFFCRCRFLCQKGSGPGLSCCIYTIQPLSHCTCFSFPIPITSTITITITITSTSTITITILLFLSICLTHNNSNNICIYIYIHCYSYSLLLLLLLLLQLLLLLLYTTIAPLSPPPPYHCQTNLVLYYHCTILY